MSIYYFANIMVYIVSFVNQRVILLLIPTVIIFAISFLPPTDYDFILYQSAYENLVYTAKPPFYFDTRVSFTAEGGWYLYTGLLSLLIEDYRHFLIVNFVLSYGIIIFSLKNMRMNIKKIEYVILMMAPVQFIVISFWSPRSLLPFALSLASVSLFKNKKYLMSVALAFITVSIHSQYGPFVLYSAIYFTLVSMRNGSNGSSFSMSTLIITAVIIIFSFFMFIYFRNILTFLPTYDFIVIKSASVLSENAQSGFRATAVLSILLFPSLLFVFWKKIVTSPEGDIIILMTIFGMIVNIIFINNPHVSGRISRISDYILFGYYIFIAFSFRKYFLRYSVIVILITSPFMFPDLYEIKEIFWFLS